MDSKVVSVPLRVAFSATRSTLRITTKLVGFVASEVIDQVQHRAASSAAQSTATAHSASGPSAATNGRPAAPSGTSASANGSPPSPSDGAVAAASEPSSATPAAVPEPELADLDTVSPLEEQPDTPLTKAEADAKTIDDTDEVVAEFAEPGAEDGAGAQLDLGEPWAGYDQANAETITNAIASADAAELVLIELYEQSHKHRKTVLEAAAKRLKALSPPNGA